MQRVLPLIILAFFFAASPASALEPDQIALVVNKNVPASTKLAEYYAQARHIPADRIIALDLPGAEEIPLDRYERDIVPPIRKFLRDHQLEKQVTCLVPFYGMPIRIGARKITPEEQAELTTLQNENHDVLEQIGKSVGDMEKVAIELDPTSALLAGGKDLDGLVRRTDASMHVILTKAAASNNADRQREIFAQILDPFEKLTGKPAVLEWLRQRRLVSTTQPGMQEELQKNKDLLASAHTLSNELSERRYDAEARESLRKITRETFGMFSYARVLRAQIEYLTSISSAVSAVDNELALLWWKAYPRQGMQPNPMYYATRIAHLPQIIMVMRLDGPQEGTARDIIVSSIKAETEGLQGKVVIDAGGAKKIDPGHKSPAYWEFDTFLNELRKIVSEQAKLTVVYDDRPDVFPANSIKDVAMYVGWYNLRHYVPACQFNPGAIAYHVASSELVSLRSDNEKGWVHGLLNDGVAATVGPVAEPYLNTFPRPDDFYPLVLTGKLTLAEAYWRTTPMTSWMMCAIGDPLYTPYKTNPKLKIEDLPDRLKPIFESPDAFEKP